MLKSLITPAEPVPAARLGRVHFIGIGGAGMSGIARIMLARGISVSGSDAMPSAMLDALQAQGARVHVGHAAANLGDLGPGDTLVLSSAIRADNPELAEATRRGLRVMHRAAALASVMAGRRVIAVAGTHGKTTTTSMLTTVLRDCGADPGYVIGGVLTETGLGAEDGAGMDFVAEADESDGSFLLLSPDVAIVTNVEADHLDNYGSLAEIEAAFATFGSHVSSLVLTCADDPGAEAVAARLESQSPQRVRRYGESVRADYRLDDVKAQGLAVSFAVTADHSPFGEIFAQMTVHVPGRHNALNATAAFAAAVELGFAPPRVTAALARYQGARRRMELKGQADGVRVFDSYAHHPTELAADLHAARDIAAAGSGGHRGVVPPGASRADGRIIAIFQPHLYSRTRIFAGEFGAALGLADQAVVLDVYAAREDPEPGVTGRLVADAVPGGQALFLPDRTQVAPLIARIAEPGDVVLTMGAGDVTALGPQLVEAIGRRHG
ncbi:MAG TPA: UDP-N-acetylmuramate--L-alanine ligase [Streptosporangiaceae bacterium]|nr:UDP-N-acetylmuramate--L-alanine ligase [Streptosporangiaceae bacterium]